MSGELLCLHYYAYCFNDHVVHS